MDNPIETNSTENSQNSQDSLKSYIFELFYSDINNSSGFDPLSDKYTPLFESVYSYCLDQGVRRKAIIDNLNIPDTEPEPGVAMLNRTGLIYYVEKKGIESFDYHFLDIASMRQADLAGCGDWLLNKIAAKIKEVAGDNVSCRYGGDEFVIITAQGTDKQHMLDKLKSEISQIKGFYAKSDNLDEFEEKQVQVKDDKIKTIKPPVDQEDLKIFKTFISRGVILDQDQIDKIKSRPDFSIENLEEKYWQASALYPDNMLTEGEELSVKARVNYLNTIYPQFKPALNLTLELDKQESDPNQISSKRTEATLQFIERVIFDRLLKDVFYSYQHIAEGLAQGKYEELWAIDSKFLKEINDNNSYLEGDELIEAVWNKLHLALGKERGAFDIARRGGTFVFGLKSGNSLSSEIRDNLDGILSFKHTLDSEEIEIPLGISHRKVDKLENLDKQWIREQLSVIEEAEESWYDQINKLNLDWESDTTQNPLLRLLKLYFSNPKRQAERNRQLNRTKGEKNLV